MYLTYFDANSWLIDIDGIRILLDPWLVGDLTFGNASWFFKGIKQKVHKIPENLDLILLSQGLPDHAHIPTLQKLDRNLPVVASPNAEKVVQKLGYSTITSLAHGESYRIKDRLEIKAIEGSPIGPTLIENAYIIKDLKSGKTLYYEPHGYHSQKIKTTESIDVVITPMVSLNLPLIGPFIRGQKYALELCQAIKPQVILSTAAGDDVGYEGLLAAILREEGTVGEFNELLKQKGLSTIAINPQSGEGIELSLV